MNSYARCACPKKMGSSATEQERGHAHLDAGAACAPSSRYILPIRRTRAARTRAQTHAHKTIGLADYRTWFKRLARTTNCVNTFINGVAWQLLPTATHTLPPPPYPCATGIKPLQVPPAGAGTGCTHTFAARVLLQHESTSTTPPRSLSLVLFTSTWAILARTRHGPGQARTPMAFPTPHTTHTHFPTPHTTRTHCLLGRLAAALRWQACRKP